MFPDSLARHNGHCPLAMSGGRRGLGLTCFLAAYLPLAFFCAPLNADESGVPFWTSGQYASLAAVPASPGWSLDSEFYFYSGDASLDESFTHGGRITSGLESRGPLLILQPTWSPHSKWLGGQASLGLGFGYGRNFTRAQLSISPLDLDFSQSDSLWGLTDVYPVLSIAWNQGVDNWMVYLTGDIPVGAYDATRLANLGIGHAAMDGGGAYTYFNQETGWEFSATAGLTFNWENHDTQYKNGIDSHLDWAVSRFLSPRWELGVAGYFYYQLSGDSGEGAVLGPFKSRVAAVGPQAAYTFKFGRGEAYANLRGYWEFAAKNRLEGYAVFFNLVLPLGHARKESLSR